MLKNYPLIGIPCRADTSGTYPGRPINAQNESYVHAVTQAGGLPVLIPVILRGEMLHALFAKVDGLLFTGGGDIDPMYYDELPEVANLEHIQKFRDELEIELMQLAMRSHKPFFAICRGFQVMNVAGGGKLWQDLLRQKPQTMRHDYHHDTSLGRGYLAHAVSVAPDSLLRHILEADSIRVNSLHHQGVRVIPEDLRAVAEAEDGVIEALEAVDHPFGLGVQWHPEELVDEYESARLMFRAFINAANEYRRDRA